MYFTLLQIINPKLVIFPLETRNLLPYITFFNEWIRHPLDPPLPPTTRLGLDSLSSFDGSGDLTPCFVSVSTL